MIWIFSSINAFFWIFFVAFLTKANNGCLLVVWLIAFGISSMTMALMQAAKKGSGDRVIP